MMGLRRYQQQSANIIRYRHQLRVRYQNNFLHILLLAHYSIGSVIETKERMKLEKYQHVRPRESSQLEHQIYVIRPDIGYLQHFFPQQWSYKCLIISKLKSKHSERNKPERTNKRRVGRQQQKYFSSVAYKYPMVKRTISSR